MSELLSNPKTTLVELCQRYCGRSMDKTDIVYTTTEYDGMYQATVKIDCVAGQEFAGELCPTPKAAEQACAQQALEGLREDIGIGAKGGRNKRKAADPGEEVFKALKVDAPDARVKTKLKEACKQILGRDLTEEDMVYEVSSAGRGLSATLSLPSLPGDLGLRSWSGTVSPFKRDAMLSAAAEALDAILADPEMSSAVDLNKVAEEEVRRDPRKKTGAEPWAAKGGKSWGAEPWTPKGKSPGKGKWSDPWSSWGWYAPPGWKGKGGGWGGEPAGKGGGWYEPVGKSGGWGKNGGWGEPEGKGGGRGKSGCWGEPEGKGGGRGAGAGGSAGSKGRRRPSGADLPRERITEVPTTGEVVEWKGKFGWVHPHDRVDHPLSKKNRGRLFVSIMDAPDQTALEVGTTVQFQVYSDDSGLGAEEVQLF